MVFTKKFRNKLVIYEKGAVLILQLKILCLVEEEEDFA